MKDGVKISKRVGKFSDEYFKCLGGTIQDEDFNIISDVIEIELYREIGIAVVSQIEFNSQKSHKVHISPMN